MVVNYTSEYYFILLHPTNHKALGLGKPYIPRVEVKSSLASIAFNGRTDIFV